MLFEAATIIIITAFIFLNCLVYVFLLLIQPQALGVHELCIINNLIFIVNISF
jgi:hypothetical protein